MAVLAVLVIFLCIVLAVFFFYTAMLITIFFEAPFVPSSKKAARVMLNVARIKPGELVYDLGSGDGRLVRGAARLGAKAIGVERSWLLIWWCRAINVILARLERQIIPSFQGGMTGARYIRDSFYNVDLSNADVVFTYLFPNVMGKLKAKFENELRPGARVISYAFKVPGWTAQERIQYAFKSPAVYVYLRQAPHASNYEVVISRP